MYDRRSPCPASTAPSTYSTATFSMRGTSTLTGSLVFSVTSVPSVPSPAVAVARAGPCPHPPASLPEGGPVSSVLPLELDLQAEIEESRRQDDRRPQKGARVGRVVGRVVRLDRVRVEGVVERHRRSNDGPARLDRLAEAHVGLV